MKELTLNAKLRTETGKASCRRLRRLNQEIPSIIYGAGEATNITIAHKDVIHIMENEEFYSQIVTIQIGDKKEEVIVKELQRHPAKNSIYHVDFQRVDYSKKLQTSVPLHFINEDICVGVKNQGGLIAHNATEIEITCLPKDLPSNIEVDIAKLELGQVYHISDLTLPKGVESVALIHGDLPIVSIIASKAEVEETESEETTEETEENTES